MIDITLALLAVGFALFSCRLVVGPSLSDRVVAVDGMILCGIAALVVDAVDSADGTFLPVAVVFTLVGFISTAVVARFIEGQGR